MIGNQPPAILLGLDRLVGLQLARILWRHAVPVIGVAPRPGLHYCQTRAVLKVVPFAHVDNDPETWLCEIGNEYGCRPVVIPCADEFVWWLNDHREIVSRHADFLLPPTATLEMLADMRQFYAYAQENELPLSPTRFASTLEELQAAAHEMSFPLMLKPPRKSAAWMKASADFGVVMVESPDELQAVAPNLLASVDELIVQQWVAGPDANLHSLFFYLDRDSQPLVTSLVAKKLRQWPPGIGSGSLAVEVKAEELVEAGLDILKRSGYQGPGSIQFKQDAAGENFYIVGITAHATLNFPLFEVCGVEANYTGYRATAGLSLPDRRSITRPGSKWICWKSDLRSSYVLWKRGDLGMRDWWASLRGPKWSADIQWTDPMPLAYDILGKITRGLSQRIRRLLPGKK